MADWIFLPVQLISRRHKITEEVQIIISGSLPCSQQSCSSWYPSTLSNFQVNFSNSVTSAPSHRTNVHARIHVCIHMQL